MPAEECAHVRRSSIVAFFLSLLNIVVIQNNTKCQIVPILARSMLVSHTIAIIMSVRNGFFSPVQWAKYRHFHIVFIAVEHRLVVDSNACVYAPNFTQLRAILTHAQLYASNRAISCGLVIARSFYSRRRFKYIWVGGNCVLSLRLVVFRFHPCEREIVSADIGGCWWYQRRWYQIFPMASEQFPISLAMRLWKNCFHGGKW